MRTRAYCGQLADRQAPASVNAALAALRRFYAWAVETGQIERDLTRNLVNVERRLPITHSSLSEHPLPHLYAAGVAITLNSDDPALFGTTLNDEVALLADPFGLDVSAIVGILLNTVRHCFLPAREKVQLGATFRAQLDVLKVTHMATLTPDRA